MTMYGANPEQLSDLGQTFKRQVAPIDQLIAAVNSALAGTTWEGPAATRFKEDWHGTFCSSLDGIKSALEAAGQDCIVRSQDLMKVMGSSR
jgi:hypothetical protein